MNRKLLTKIKSEYIIKSSKETRNQRQEDSPMGQMIFPNFKTKSIKYHVYSEKERQGRAIDSIEYKLGEDN